MAVRANNDPKFYFRFLLIGLGAVGLALWSLYDGYVVYPDQRERGLAFQKFLDEDRGDEWDAYARERGWPAEYPGEPKSQADIYMQYAMAVLAGSIGLVALAVVWRSRSRWIEATETGVTSSWGQQFDFSQVTGIDKRQWEKKGIAKVGYEDGGRRRRFVVDNYKFMQHPTNDLLAAIEANIDPELITGGPPESAATAADEADQQPAAEEAGQPN